MISDADGRLWIATWDGLNVYDGATVTVFKHHPSDSTSLSGNVVLGLLKDATQRIWVLTDNQTVSSYEGDGIFKAYHFSEQPDALALTKDGRIAVAIQDEFLVLTANAFLKHTAQQIQTTDHLGVLKHFLLQKYPELIINDIFKDSEGNIWYATRRNGLYIIPNTPKNVNNQFIEHYTYDLYSPYSFTSNEIEKIYQDDFGNIWLAHKDGGVSMAYNGAEQITTIIPHPVKFPHLPNETIRAITKDNQSTIWLGYYTKGLFYYSEQTHCFLPFEIKEATENEDWNRIRSLYTDAEGTVWAGTYNGVIKITKNGYQLLNATNTPNFPYNRNYAFCEDDKHLWVACWGGLGKLDTETATFKRFPHQEVLNDYHIRYVIKQQDTLVLATEANGVLFFTEQEGIIKRITTADGILGNSIYRIHFDTHTGYYWIAALGGISVYATEKGIIKNISEADGLPSHMVYGLLSNGSKMWISTTKGIATIDTHTYQVFQLPKDQGWQAEEFSEGASYQDRKGMLFFGGINGLSYFQPDAYHYSLKPPKLHVVIDGKENYTQRLSKTYSHNSLSVQLTPVSFSGVHPAIYYQLKGFDTDWKLYNGQELLYHNLSAGDYTLLTRIEGEQGSVHNYLELHIGKPFYQTSWFFVLCLLVLVGLVSGVIVRKNRTAKRIQRELEEKIRERTATVEDQKATLQRTNEELEARHTELNVQKEQILALHHQLKNRDFEVEKFKTFVLSGFKPKLSKIVQELQKVSTSGKKTEMEQELFALIQTISEWDYLDHVQALGAVANSQVQFKKLIRRIYENIQLGKITIEAKFTYEIMAASELIAIDVLRLKLLFQYLLNEVLKYSDSASKLTVSTVLEEKDMIITLQSNSALLREQWENIQDYSPYYKAFETLLKDLAGVIQQTTSKELSLTITIPVVNVQQQTEASGVLLLKHLEQSDAQQKPSILVYCDADDVELVQHLLENTSYQLVFEHDANALPSALQQINVKALVVYNALFTSALIQVISQPAFKQLPSLYIAEHIDLEMEEKVMDHGMSAIIYLPVRAGFIEKKIQSILQQRKKVFSAGGYDLLSDSAATSVNLNPNEKLVKQALELIRKELGNAAFNIDILHSTLDISRTKCYRIFKEVLQQSPSDVLINLRLQKAEQLLLHDRLNISEISFECGFNDPKYFSRMFKKHFGASPKSYKQQQQNEFPV